MRDTKQHGVPLTFIRDALKSVDGSVALDIAAGQGRHTHLLLESQFSVTAVEQDSEKCARLSQMCPAATIVQRDVEQCGLPRDWTARFDLVVMTYFLWRPLFAEIERVLKPGGHFLMETFHIENQKRRGRPRRSHFALSGGEGAALSQDVGFHLVQVDENERGDVYSTRVWARKPTAPTTDRSQSA